MRLRKNVERFWPLGEDQVHLSEEARTSVFRGRYTRYLMHREFVAPTDPRAGNWNTVVIKHSPDIQQSEVINHYRKLYAWAPRGENPWVFDHQDIINPNSNVVAEFTKEKALNRANHVEKIARRIKLSAGAFLAAGVVALGLTEVASADQIHNLALDTGAKVHTDGTAPVNHQLQRLCL